MLNGHKRWIGNRHLTDVMVLFARNTGDGNVNAFVIEKDDDGRYPTRYSPTVSTGKGERAIFQADIVIEQMRLAAVKSLEGFPRSVTCPACSSQPVAGRPGRRLTNPFSSFEIAADYAQTRHQFGKPVASYQLGSHGWRACSAS
ncbi:hypothetical protein [Pseudarthrobacter phenanthrenivorans]|uniref:hypothetical protein n=1 Tax=Pseudarthrobacter phenanthrenivorans TaxID=361575 RepID=UPI002F361064